VNSLQTYFGLEGKTALVTGAARGIGRAVAEALAGCGATVVVSDLNGQACEEVAASIRESGGSAFGIAMDIGDEAAIKSGFAKAEELLGGKLDIIVNNAGIMCVVPIFDETRMDMWDKAYQINVRGTFICAREAAKIMIRNGEGGRIINISSSSAVRPVLDGVAPYSSSKGAVSTFSQSLCYELAPHGINVNVVMPHSIMHADITTQYEENKTPVTGGQAVDPGRYRLPRQGRPQDIASLVAFLAGPGGDFISGQSIAVDGGYLLT